MHSLLSGFVNYIKKEHLFQRNDKLLVAVSGGVDSTVLCDLCYEAAYDFAIVHCNFQLRGEESTRDEDFVASLALKYKVPIFIKKFETEAYAEERKVSIQVAARELRYGWFRVLLNKEKEQFIHNIFLLTAHHTNDNTETLLMNIFKGTGVRGMKGISPKQDKIVRPLLFASKENIINYASEKELAFVEDSSNTSDKYTRNYFRNQLIPGLGKIYPSVEQNLQKNIDRFKEVEILYDQALEIHKKKLIKKVQSEIHIPVRMLLKTEPLQTVLYEILKPYDFSSMQIGEVTHLLKSETGKFVMSSSHRVLRNRDWLIVAPLDTTIAENIVIDENVTETAFGPFIIKIKTHINKADFITSNELTACIDKSKLVFPLLLRKWKTGDYFYPLGMQKKKKLSKFYSDNKLSMVDKEKVWVLESDKRIVWIVGMRLDDRFKINAATESVLKLTII